MNMYFLQKQFIIQNLICFLTLKKKAVYLSRGYERKSEENEKKNEKEEKMREGTKNDKKRASSSTLIFQKQKVFDEVNAILISKRKKVLCLDNVASESLKTEPPSPMVLYLLNYCKRTLGKHYNLLKFSAFHQCAANRLGYCR